MVFALILHALAIAFAWGVVQYHDEIEFESIVEAGSVVALSKTTQQAQDIDVAEEDSKDQTEPELDVHPIPVREDIEFVEMPEITEPAPGRSFRPSVEAPQIDQPTLPAAEYVRAEGLPEPYREPAVGSLSAPTKPVQKPVQKPTTTNKTTAKPKARKGNTVKYTPPRMLKQDWPSVIEKRFVGTIIAIVKINQYGHATSVSIIKGTGRDSWDHELKLTFLKAAYAPATRNGRPANGSLRFNMKFK